MGERLSSDEGGLSDLSDPELRPDRTGAGGAAQTCTGAVSPLNGSGKRRSEPK